MPAPWSDGRLEGSLSRLFGLSGLSRFSEPDKPNEPNRPDEPDPATRRELGFSSLFYRENGASRENPLPSCAPRGRGVLGRAGSVSRGREHTVGRRLLLGSWRPRVGLSPLPLRHRLVQIYIAGWACWFESRPDIQR